MLCASWGQRLRIGIIGSGPAGLSVAYYLSHQDSQPHDICVFERAAQTGGFHQSFERGGHIFDTGCFLFFRGHGALSFQGLFPKLFAPVDNPDVAFRLRGTVRPFPPSWRALLGMLPAVKRLLFPVHYAVSVPYYRWRLKRSANLEDWFCSRMSRWGYEVSGLSQYVIKLFGQRTAGIDVEFAKQRLHDVDRVVNWKSAWRIAKSMVPQKPAPPQPAALPSVLYPVAGGAGSITRHLTELLQSRGVRFRTACRVNGISRQGGVYTIATGDGETVEVDRVISTIPISILSRICGLGEKPVLEHRHLLMIYLVVGRPRALGAAGILYSYEPHHMWKRATSYSELRRIEASKTETALGVEVTFADPPGAVEVQSCVENVIASLTDECGYFRRDEIRLVETEVMPGAYPVFRVGYREVLEKAKGEIAGLGIISFGSAGGFDNIDSHDCVCRAREVAARIQAAAGPA